MAERYSQLYLLPEDLYTPGAPLVIAAGALLRDTLTGQLIAQLKLQSITGKTITAVKLFVAGLDGSDAELCREEHEYLNLNVSRDELFGAKDAIVLPDPAVRSFTVQVLDVHFSDGSRYLGNGERWMPLPEQKDLNAQLFDTELIRQYRIETTEQSRYVPMETLDLWFCTCGEINHPGENCYRCGESLTHCTSLLNVETLREDKSLRLNAEAAQAAIDEQRRRDRNARLKRVCFLLIPLLVIAGLAAGAFFFASHRNALYEEASAYYAAGDYAEAAQRFEKLGRFRDASQLAQEARKADALQSSYRRAVKLLENARFDDAYELFAELGDYEDSAELALEARYRKGEALLAEGVYAEAPAVFTALGAYRDAARIAAHFFDRLVSEETSFNAECGGPLTTVYEYDDEGRVFRKIEQFSAYEGQSDRVSVYQYNADDSWTVTENQVEKHYDVQGNLLGEGDTPTYEYEYGFYEDGSVQYWIRSTVWDGEYCGSMAYDEQGNPTRVENEDGTSYSFMNEYKDGRLVKSERYDNDGTMLDRTTYDYDGQGHLKRASTLTPGNISAVITNYAYGLIYVPEGVE